jgi:hypothetical protein
MPINLGVKACGQWLKLDSRLRKNDFCLTNASLESEHSLLNIGYASALAKDFLHIITEPVKKQCLEITIIFKNLHTSD